MNWTCVTNSLAVAIVAAATTVGGSSNAQVLAQSTGRSGVASRELSVAQAIAQAQRSGQPIFAVAGANYCPACKVLLNTLNTDESLRPLLSQFVALKINAEGRDYARWRQFFPPERSAIPALFIVTPQGKQLFGKVGALPSKNLHSIMLTSLEKAGRYPTKGQWEEIAQILESAEKALQEEQIDRAIELLQPMLESLDKLGSLAEVSETGRKATALVEQFATEQREVLDTALQSFADENDLDAALQVATAERLGEMFPQLRSHVTVEIKKATSNSAKRKLLRQARELHKAETMARQAPTRRKAVRLLKQIVKRYPQAEVAARGEQMLRTLGEEAPRTAIDVSQGERLRRWSDSSGKFSIKARLVKIDGDRVRLERADGKVLSIRISQLDEQGQEYVAGYRP